MVQFLDKITVHAYKTKKYFSNSGTVKELGFIDADFKPKRNIKPNYRFSKFFPLHCISLPVSGKVEYGK
jgi:hypothetical protein